MEKRVLTIKPTPPFDFNLSTRIFSDYQIQSVDYFEQESYKRILNIDGENVFTITQSTGSLKNPKLLVNYFSGKKKISTNNLKQKIEWIFVLNDNLNQFYKIASKDGVMKRITNAFCGLRPPRTPSIFEALIIAISEQQISLRAALSLRARLAEKYGEIVCFNKKNHYAFPAPEQLAKAGINNIKKLGFNQNKSECIVKVSKLVVSGKLNLEKYQHRSINEIINDLTSIRGIGNWTVEYMMCRGMGRYDALPTNDIALIRAISKFYKKSVSAAETSKILNKFNKYKGYAAFYLIYAYALEKDPKKLPL